MEYQQAIIKVDSDTTNDNYTPLSIFGKLKENKAEVIVAPTVDEDTLVKPRKRGRPPKKKNNDATGEVVAEVVTNEPYINSYDETNNMLKIMISQADNLQGELKQEFNDIRLSKMRGKYQYLSDISSTISSLFSIKLQAVKELNSVITNAHKMELSRTKELKLDQNNNDDAAIMGLYENILNTPRQQLEQGFMPPILESGMASLPIMAQPAMAMDLIQPMEVNDRFTPEQNRMILESNPDVKTVVVYDPKNETKEFKMMNVSTGSYIDNVSLPDPFLLEDMNVNFQTGIARNSNVNMNFPLAVLENGVPTMISDNY